MSTGFCKVQVNTPAGWRQKLAQRLVRACQWLDGSRWYLAIGFESSPEIGQDEQRAIIIKGHDTMSKLARDTVLAGLVEEAMRVNVPRLYREEKTMQTCSHGLPLQVKCQQCTQEALSRPACYETYWIAGHGCKKPVSRCAACVGCAYHAEGQQS